MPHTLYLTGTPGAYHGEVKNDETGVIRKVLSGRDAAEIERICRARFADDLKVVNHADPPQPVPVPVVVAAPEPEEVLVAKPKRTPKEAS